MSERTLHFLWRDGVSVPISLILAVFTTIGTAADVVPIGPNSIELARRYRELGGSMELETIEGGKHGGPEFYRSQGALEFLLE